MDQVAPPIIEGTYRWTEIRDLCSRCNAVTNGVRCVRCGAPLCDAHDHRMFERRCYSCEAQFERLVQDRKHHPVPLLPLISIYLLTCTGVIAAVVATSFWRGFPLLTGAVAAGLVALGPLLAATHRRRRLRPLFLAERPGRRRLRYHAPEAVAEQRPAAQALPVRTAALVGFVFAVGTWFFPALPAIGLALGIYAVATPRRQRGYSGLNLAWAAIPCGAVFTTLQALVLIRAAW